MRFLPRPKRPSHSVLRANPENEEQDEYLLDQKTAFSDEDEDAYSNTSRIRCTWHRLVIGILMVVIAMLSTTLLYPISSRPRSSFMHKINGASSRTSKAVVLASFQDQDVTWLENLSADWQVHRYMVDNPNYSNLTIPRNQGHEAMPYLTYIIDNYHNLPTYTVFLHGHARSWHQPELPSTKLADLNSSALDKDRYINLRCGRTPGCTRETYLNIHETSPGDTRPAAKILPKFWRMLFTEEMGSDSMGPPSEELAVPCCAQVAVTREAVLARSLDFWKKMRRPLERDLSEFREELGVELDSYTMGLVYEQLWHGTFGMEAVHCPDEDYCRKIQFSGAITCDRYTTTYEDAMANGWEDIKCTTMLDG